jgi:hypothetical protein
VPEGYAIWCAPACGARGTGFCLVRARLVVRGLRPPPVAPSLECGFLSCLWHRIFSEVVVPARRPRPGWEQRAPCERYLPRNATPVVFFRELVCAEARTLLTSARQHKLGSNGEYAAQPQPLAVTAGKPLRTRNCVLPRGQTLRTRNSVPPSGQTSPTAQQRASLAGRLFRPRNSVATCSHGRTCHVP